VSDIGDAEIVLLGPEEWDGVKTYAPTQNVACGGLSLALSDYEMLDADALAGEAIRPASDVASSENARGAGLEIFVDDDAAISGKTRALCQLGLRSHPDADDMRSAWILSPLVSVTLRSSIEIAVVPR